MRRTRVRGAAAGRAPSGLLSLGLLVAPPALAHGFGSHGTCLVTDAPTVYSLAFPRGAPGQVVAMTNFGVLRSDDGGASFGWGCVDGYALSPGEDFLDGAPKTLSVLDDGTLYVLYTVGYRESRNGGCSYRFAPDPSLLNASVVQVASSPASPDVAFAVASAPGQPPFGLFRSDDGGVDYALTSLAIYDFGVPVTSFVSSADGATLYVLSLSISGVPTLWRSDDGGVSFAALPMSLPVDDAVLLGVDPADAQVLYLELTDEPSGLCAFRTRVLRSDDGGATFRPVQQRVGDVLTGALVRDDGSLWLSWLQAGLERVATDGEVSSRAALPLSCLAEDAEGIVVCPFGGEPALALRYDDESDALAPFLTRADITGPLACEAGTRGADVCTPQWPQAAAVLELGSPPADAGVLDGGLVDAALDGGEDTAPPEAGVADAGAPNAGQDAGQPGWLDAGRPDAGHLGPDAGAPEPPTLDVIGERRTPSSCQAAAGAPLSMFLVALVACLPFARVVRRLAPRRARRQSSRVSSSR